MSIQPYLIFCLSVALMTISTWSIAANVEKRTQTIAIKSINTSDKLLLAKGQSYVPPKQSRC